MSLLINWSRLTQNESEQARNIIQKYIDDIELPDWLMFLKIESFDWGIDEPFIEILDICEPFDLFRFQNSYHDQRTSPMTASPVKRSNLSDESSVDHLVSPTGSPQKSIIVSPMAHAIVPRPPNILDFQIIVNAEYSGSISMALSTEFALNVPSTAFMSLPLKLRITKMSIKCSIAVVHIGPKFHLCILTPESSPSHEIKPFELNFETHWDVGDAEKRVLRNASKLEPFLHELLHNVVKEHLLFPKFYTVDIAHGDDELDQDLD